MFQTKVKTILDESKKILLCGCGGGYDIYSGMPIFCNYREKTVLGNITFAAPHLVRKITETPHDGYVKIDYKTCKDHLVDEYPGNYVPEYWLSKHVGQPVYIISPSGVQTLVKIFAKIIEDEGIDTIVLIDGGIDSMMFGDEEDIGTYSEDMATIVAVSTLPVTKVLVTNAWGVEGLVSHERYLENVATMIRQNGFLGAQFLEKDSPEGQFYIQTLEACFPENSTINSSIHASITGQEWTVPHKFLKKRYSDYEVNTTFHLQDWVGCPLGGVYWFFDLDKVVENIVYKDMLLTTVTLYDVDHGVHLYRYNEGLVNDDGNYTGKRTSTFF